MFVSKGGGGVFEGLPVLNGRMLQYLDNETYLYFNKQLK